MNRLSMIAASLAVTCLAIGCASPRTTGHPILIDPSETSPESGGTDDIYESVQRALASLARSPKVSQQKNNRVVLSQIVNRTGEPNYDENIIYNKFLSALTNTSEKLIFLDRASVAEERALQQSGEVTTEGVDLLAGAAMALKIELRNLQGYASKTIQYTFRLTNLDGIIVWTDSFEIKKRL